MASNPILILNHLVINQSRDLESSPGPAANQLVSQLFLFLFVSFSSLTQTWMEFRGPFRHINDL